MTRLILSALLSLLLSLGAAAAPIKLATEGAYPPFNTLDDAGKVSGFDIDLGNELCKRAGLECVWVTNEWDTLIANLTASNYDAIVSDMTITDDRLKTIDFTDEYFQPDPSNYLSVAGKLYDYSALKGLKLGGQSGSAQASYLQTLKADNTIIAVDAEQAMTDLNAGTLDLYLAEGSYVDEQVAASNGALKSDGPDIPIGKGAAIGVRKADTDLKGKLNTALAAVKADGWLDALIAKYFPDLGPAPYFKPN